jgi:hypothetical protein
MLVLWRAENSLLLLFKRRRLFLEKVVVVQQLSSEQPGKAGKAKVLEMYANNCFRVNLISSKKYDGGILWAKSEEHYCSKTLGWFGNGSCRGYYKVPIGSNVIGVL